MSRLVIIFLDKLKMADTMKLSYFDERARAELSRLLLAHAGVKYEDNRVTEQTFQALKPSK